MELVVTALVMVIYTILISTGYGKRMDYSVTGRPILAAVGFLIILSGYAWSKHSFEMFQELVMWALIACFPILIRGSILYFQEVDAKTKQDEQTAVERHSVLDVVGMDD